jgi:uncharacterized lipoprotein YajG
MKWRPVPAKIVLFVGIVLSGCATPTYDLHLDPQSNVSPAAVGSSTKLYISFADERDETLIGYRGVQPYAEKLAAPDLPTILEKQLRDGLKQKGFEITDMQSSADATVTFRLHAFKFDFEKGIWTNDANISAVLAVDARRGARTYSNVYRYDVQDTMMGEPYKTDLDNRMNTALSEVLHKALSDENLDLLLVGKSGG